MSVKFLLNLSSIIDAWVFYIFVSFDLTQIVRKFTLKKFSHTLVKKFTSGVFIKFILNEAPMSETCTKNFMRRG